MKPYRQVLGLLGLALSLVTVACSPEAGHDAEEDRAAIAAASRTFSAAFMAGDTATIGALYTEDAVLLPPTGNVQGNDRIRAFFAPAEGRRQIAHTLTSESLLIDGDLAIDIGRWESTTQRDGAEARTSSERYLVVWQRQADGSWKLAYDAWHWPRPSN